MCRWLLIVAGVLSVGLATAGIFLPLLPTTPFLLLAAACFFRASDRLYQWLIDHRWLGPYIKNYREHRAITRRARIVILLMLWCTLGYAALTATHSLAIRILLSLIGIGVTVHVMSIRTLPLEIFSDKVTTTTEDVNEQEMHEATARNRSKST
ncbi:MAG: YbaN family protein [Candidatus Krumholzibacteriota bacterium]|nr:YbaN family protein [Candidatus Krumholzibacteriota bacterium]